MRNSWSDEYLLVKGPKTDTPTTTDACTDGVVGLMHCQNPATKWYDSGKSQLLSLTCWKAGYSTVLSVGGVNDTLKELKSIQVDDVIPTVDTFMFVNHLPDPPFHLPDP